MPMALLVVLIAVATSFWVILQVPQALSKLRFTKSQPMPLP